MIIVWLRLSGESGQCAFGKFPRYHSDCSMVPLEPASTVVHKHLHHKHQAHYNKTDFSRGYAIAVNSYPPI